jgi:hypothetical protein
MHGNHSSSQTSLNDTLKKTGMIITSNALRVSNDHFLSPPVLVAILSTVPLHPALPLCIASTQNVIGHLIIVHFQ